MAALGGGGALPRRITGGGGGGAEQLCFIPAEEEEGLPPLAGRDRSGKEGRWERDCSGGDEDPGECC